jgi:nicotinate-nucleotide adenylyltransferase
LARVGILGGTFNPPHVGHLAVARSALDQLELDRVVLVPAGIPPHKAIECEPGPMHRLEMCRLTAAANPRIEVSSVELDRPGPSYTVDTLRLLHEQAPDDELTLIVGSDMAVGLPTWRDPEGILGLATLAVATRVGAEREMVRNRLADLRGAERVAFLDMEEVDVSSSLVRERAAQGLEIEGLVAPGVADYIEEHALYRKRGVRETQEVPA